MELGKLTAERKGQAGIRCGLLDTVQLEAARTIVDDVDNRNNIRLGKPPKSRSLSGEESSRDTDTFFDEVAHTFRVLLAATPVAEECDQ